MSPCDDSGGGGWGAGRWLTLGNKRGIGATVVGVKYSASFSQ